MILIFESREQFLKLANLSSQDLQTITDNVLSSIEKHYKGGLVKNQKTILHDLHKISKLVNKYTGKPDKYNEFANSDNKLLQVIHNCINNFVRAQGIKVDPFSSLKTSRDSDKGNKIDGFDVYAKIIKQVVNKLSTFIYNQTALIPTSKKSLNVLKKMLKFNNDWDVVEDDPEQSESLLQQTLKKILNKMLEFNFDIIDLTSDDQVKTVLQSMLKLNNVGDTDFTDDVSETQRKYMFKCIRKNDSRLSDKQYRYDVYIPVDKQYRQQLKEKLGIEYFALQYTTTEPSEIERVLRSPTNTNKLMNAQNCQFAAFNSENEPMYEFRSWYCHLERGENKNDFRLVNGAIPNLSSPDRNYDKQQFITVIKRYIHKSLSDKGMEPYIDVLLSVVFDDLSNRQSHGVVYSNMLTQQLINEDKTFIQPTQDLLNSIIVKILPHIIEQQQNANTTQQQPNNNTVNQ